MAEIVELEIPARPEYLALARVLVASAAGADPLFPEERLDDLRLAVSEACTNAIEAHAAVRASGPLHIRCELGPDRVEVVVTDQGQGFDPGALVSHPPAAHPDRLHHERGLGIPLIRILSDEVTFAPTEYGTSVRMCFDAGRAPADA